MKEPKAPQQQGTPPKLVSRRENRKSTFRSGLTIGEKREKLETANEREAARKKDKKKKATRVMLTIVGFIGLVLLLIALASSFFNQDSSEILPEETINVAEVSKPTVEIIDENNTTDNSKITSRMYDYIGRVEGDLRDLGYHATKVVIPSGSIRVINVYLEGYPGYIKMTIDRGSAVSAEDTDRMLRYLASIEVSDYQYIDVRVDGRAFWQ